MNKLALRQACIDRALVSKITLTFCLLYLSACSTPNSITVFTPLSAEADQVALYIYRPWLMSNAVYAPDLYINDEFKLSIKNGKNSRLLLMPGEHKFELKADKNYSAITRLSLDLNASTTYFIRVDTSLEINSATDYGPYKRSFKLVKVDEQLATKEIADCCVAKNKKHTDKSEMKPTSKRPDNGFSIDKTQNPFSH